MIDINFFSLFGSNPIPLDGSKKPLAGFSWKDLQHKPFDLIFTSRVLSSHPNANWGLIIPNHICIIDIDTEDALRKFEELGIPKNVPCVQTQKGWHLYFLRPVEFKQKMLKRNLGYDVLVNGSYAVTQSTGVASWLAPNGNTIRVTSYWAALPDVYPQDLVSEGRVTPDGFNDYRAYVELDVIPIPTPSSLLVLAGLLVAQKRRR